MNRTWLLIDGDNLCARAYHTTGGLDNGVAFGFFRALVDLQDRFATDDVAIAFDRNGSAKRRLLDARYKANRDARHAAATPEERQARRSQYEQKIALRDTHLRRAGYLVLSAEGYEADDVIARVAKSLPAGDQAVVVSSDQDLYQLVSGRVTCYNPISHRVMTLQEFKSQYGILPGMWCDVKAIAGCTSDNVAGIVGIGEKRACQFLSHRMKPESNYYQRITFNSGVWQANLPLVRLPLDGCPEFPLRPGRVNPARWARVMRELGLDTLVAHPPSGARRRLLQAPKISTRYAPRKRRKDEA